MKGELMKNTLLTWLSAFSVLLGIAFMASATGSSQFAVRAQEDTMKKITHKVTDTTKTVASETKKKSVKVYRKGEVVGGRVWNGSKFVARSAWNGGTWVAVKTKNGTKWVYHKATGRKTPRP